MECAGSNFDGELCLGSRGHSSVPLVINALFGVTKLALGSDTTCALRADGTPVCCGADWHGQVGTGHDNRRPQPVRMP